MQITKQLNFPELPWPVKVDGFSSTGDDYFIDVQVILPDLGRCIIHSWQSYNLIVPAMSELDFQNRVDQLAAQVQEWTVEDVCTNLIYGLECGHYRNRGVVQNESAKISGIMAVIENILSGGNMVG